MTEQEKIQVELDLLMSLQHIEAWSGSLGELRQKSYVLYSDIVKLINKKRELLKNKRDEARDNG